MALFAVSGAQRQLVESYRPQIEKEFRVGVQLSTYADPTAAEGDGGRVTVRHGGRDQPDGGHEVLQESQPMWVEIAGDCSGAAKAKEYILSICDRGIASAKTMGRLQDGKTFSELLPYGFGDFLQGHLDKISAETYTRIERIGRTDELNLIGDETCVARAKSLIDIECAKLRQGQSQTSYGRIQVTSSKDDTPRKRLEDEGNDKPFRFTPPVYTDSQNSTLEVRPNKLTESATCANPSVRTGKEPVKLIPHSISVPASDAQPFIVQRQEKNVGLLSSMQKLGYPKEQVDTILRQLGPDAEHNNVLWALVNQSSSKTECADVVDTKEDTESRRDMSDGFPSEEASDESDNLRPIIIDGSNVAMSFGNKVVFACKGIDVAVKWFRDRGHKKIHVFVPNWRKEASKPETPISDQEILTKLEQQNFLTWTPSRRSTNGRRIVCYDDRYILRTAVAEDGIIVSNDNFRDIQNEKPEWRKVIEERLLMYAFVSERFMPPDDPLGRHGPSLDNFLRMKPTMPDHLPQACPYGKKCTYGNKCKYYHSDRPNRPMKSISETLKERDKTRKEMAKLNNERSNSPRFTTASTAPIPGYQPPEDVTSTPDWHTTPLPGANTQWSPQRKSVVSDSISSPVSTKSGSPHHRYAKEPMSQVPYPSARDEVYLGQDQQRYHQNTGMSQSLSQVPPRHLNTPPLGRAGHTSPLPNYSSSSQRANQQGMYTVPLQRYSTPSQPERGYAQFEESHNSNRMSMPATMYGSGESMGVTPRGINVERRPSHELVSGFQNLGIQDRSGVQLPREPQHNFNYRQTQYHSGEQFPGQMQSSDPADFNQGSTQPQPYLSWHQSPVMSSDPMMYSPPRRTVSQGYPSHSEPSRPNYPSSPLPMTQGSYRPTEPAKMTSPEEQGRQNILHHLSGIFGPKKVESVMRRHPTETNPQKLIKYMSTNT